MERNCPQRDANHVVFKEKPKASRGENKFVAALEKSNKKLINAIKGIQAPAAPAAPLALPAPPDTE